MSKQDIPIIGPILNRIIGTRNERFVKKYLQRTAQINALEPKYRAMTDAQLREQITVLRTRLDKGETAQDLMMDAFAVAREAMDRSVGIRKIFDPERNFDPSQLPANVRSLYDETKAKMDATPPAEPTGEWLGHTDPLPGWQQVDIPNAIYEAVRTLYPESRPPFRARPFDVQLIGAMVLYQGRIAEMKTGEGKTIVAPLATYLACIERLKVHVVTVNDYLVQRDRDWTAPYFRALGLTVGAIHPQHQQPEHLKQDMYRCDVVYGTTAEFGFDYLRDNMKKNRADQVQRRREFAIVDEVDSVLIDEARTPLIISGQAQEGAPRYELADMLARHLVQKQRPWQEAEDEVDRTRKLIKGIEGDIRNTRDKGKIPAMQDQLKAARANLPRLEALRAKHTQFYEVQAERKSVHLTHQGIAEAQNVAQIGSFYVGENMDMPHLLEQSLRAHVVYQRDRDYIIAPAENPQTGRTEPAVIIVDVSTGRPMPGRQWSDGLHQAIECKEQVPIKQETRTIATITVQNFFKMYKRLAGMTGTADTEAQEFHDIYRLDVVAIPTNKPVTRRDFDDIVFLTEKDKWDRITDEIKNFHDAGRPILVGTTSVEKSELLSEMLRKKHGVKHEVLNAKPENIERESHIVENAGQLGSVMIATNMAGRGTDIKLGKLTRESLLDHWLRRGICPREVTVESTEDQLREGIYRKMAPSELGIPKRDAESAPFADLELRLLRHWAGRHTWLSPRDVERMDADRLRKELDAGGRFLLHRIRWFNTIEELGGLHVIGTERHESRRIDNQLRGRSGRQGDKGSSRFFISLHDDLMRHFGGETVTRVLGVMGMKEGDAIEHPILSRSVEKAQRKVEEINFQRRKHILEYDEVMEHQRRTFYGLRQRAVEGRDLRGLFFQYIKDAVVTAAGDYLEPLYPQRCISEYARQQAECSIVPRSLKGLDATEATQKVRDLAREDWRNNIQMTLGEYMSGETLSLEAGEQLPDGHVDAPGLARWARERFGVELTTDEINDMARTGKRQIADRLAEAADAKIEQIDLSDIGRYLLPDFGQAEFVRWVRNKFDFEISQADVKKYALDGPEAVAQLVMTKAEAAYRKREIEFPVEFLIDQLLAMRNQDPKLAVELFLRDIRNRFGVEWTAQQLITKHPIDVRKELLAASEKAVDDGRADKMNAAAQACKNDEEMAAFFKKHFDFDIPDAMRHLDGPDRADAVRSRIDELTRAELTYFERTILLNIFDPAWQEHLVAMERLRDGINFRAYSQKDPRTEYKSEGSRMFNEMLADMRDRVTDYVFKVRFTPRATAPQGASPPPSMFGSPAARPQAPRPVGGGMITGANISNIAMPGHTPSGGLYAPPAPKPQRPENDGGSTN